MTYETFRTSEEADKQISSMRGWNDPRPEKIYSPEDAKADGDGNVWVISVARSANTDASGDRLYLRSDGFMR